MEIKVKCQEIKSESDINDIVAKVLQSYGSEVPVDDRLFIGVFSKPYGKYTDKAPPDQEQPIDSFCDKMIEGVPHSYGYRWWGKRAEDIINKLEKEGYEIVRKSNN